MVESIPLFGWLIIPDYFVDPSELIQLFFCVRNWLSRCRYVVFLKGLIVIGIFTLVNWGGGSLCLSWILTLTHKLFRFLWKLNAVYYFFVILGHLRFWPGALIFLSLELFALFSEWLLNYRGGLVCWVGWERSLMLIKWISEWSAVLTGGSFRFWYRRSQREWQNRYFVELNPFPSKIILRNLHTSCKIVYIPLMLFLPHFQTVNFLDRKVNMIIIGIIGVVALNFHF